MGLIIFFCFFTTTKSRVMIWHQRNLFLPHPTTVASHDVRGIGVVESLCIAASIFCGS